MEAYKNGYKIHPDDRITYANDKVAELTKKGQKDKFNPNTDLPEAFDVVKAQPKFGSIEWFKSKGQGAVRGALDLLPTAGGIAGGAIGGAVGVESGPGAIATRAGGAALGGAAGEALRQHLDEEAFPYDYRMSGKDKAKYIATQGGIMGLLEGIGAINDQYGMGPVARHLKDTALKSEKAGVPLLPSEAAGKAPSFLEKFAKGSILTSGKMEDFRAIQNEKTRAAVEKVADQISTFQGSQEDLGKLVQDGIAQHKKAFRAIQGQMYDDIAKDVGEHTIKVPVYETMFGMHQGNRSRKPSKLEPRIGWLII